MPSVLLPDRGLVAVDGAQAAHFLQNILTADLDGLGAGEARACALLSPQGKILFDFLISRRGEDGFLLDARGVLADDLVRRLILYRLRAKVEISKLDQDVAWVSWQGDSASSENESTSSQTDSGWLADLRFPAQAGMRRRYSDPGGGAEADMGAWQALRIAHGVAESGADYEAGDAFPHDVLMDGNGGVGLRKGCYVGQEVVSRMHHRGTARRRVMIVSGESALPATGTQVLADGRPLGALGTVAGARALAILRIDKVGQALDAGQPITAGDVPVTPGIPAGAPYALPDTAREPG